MPLDVPTLAFPLQIRDGDFVMVEQDSDQDIEGCVEAIARTPRGWFESLPDMGLQEYALTRGVPSASAIRAAIEPYEPRANLIVDSALEDMVATITITPEVRRGR